tara:strand:+ start:1346 stop:1738 length:393 start_codon:yes stop_codon:yes gene_type:complete
MKHNNEIYLKQVYTKSKNEYYLGKKKTDHLPIPESWKCMYGKYELTGEIYTAKDNTLWDISDIKATVSEKNGFLKLDVKSKSEISGTFYFDIISDKSAVLGGVGRSTGDVIKILENGNLYYSGFEFSKTK